MVIGFQGNLRRCKANFLDIVEKDTFDESHSYQRIYVLHENQYNFELRQPSTAQVVACGYPIVWSLDVVCCFSLFGFMIFWLREPNCCLGLCNMSFVACKDLSLLTAYTLIKPIFNY